MAKRYTFETTVALEGGGQADGAEFDVKVEFSVAWGSAPTPTSYMMDPRLYDPGSDSEVEDIKVVAVEGLTEGWGKAFAMGYQTDQKLADTIIAALDEDDLLTSAREEEADAAAFAEEARAERRAEWAREAW